MSCLPLCCWCSTQAKMQITPLQYKYFWWRRSSSLVHVLPDEHTGGKKAGFSVMKCSHGDTASEDSSSLVWNLVWSLHLKPHLFSLAWDGLLSDWIRRWKAECLNSIRRNPQWRWHRDWKREEAHQLQANHWNPLPSVTQSVNPGILIFNQLIKMRLTFLYFLQALKCMTH